MKTLYKALLVMALAAAMVLPVMAAPSPQAESKASKANASVPMQGAKVVALTKEVFDEVKRVTSDASILAAFGINTNAKLAAAFDLKVEIPAGQTSVTVPIKVSNAKAGDYVYVFHRKSNAEATWEVVGQGTLGADLTINGTFTDFSPVAIMVVDAAQAAAGAVKAPKTGQ